MVRHKVADGMADFHPQLPLGAEVCYVCCVPEGDFRVWLGVATVHS